MNGNPSPDAAPRLPQICAGLAGGIAWLALAGWQMNARYLAGQWDTYIPMAPSTALALLLLLCTGAEHDQSDISLKHPLT